MYLVHHLSIYNLYEISSSYTWYNFIRVTPILNHWFLTYLTVEKMLVFIVFQLIYVSLLFIKYNHL